MIDWQVLFNLLWVLGLALILAALSYADWLAHVRGLRTRKLLGAPTFQHALFTGLGLVSLGLLLLSRGWLERLLWAGLVLVLAWCAWSLQRERRLRQRTLIGNPLFLWRVVKQQLVLSTRYVRDAAQSLSKGLGLLRFDGR